MAVRRQMLAIALRLGATGLLAIGVSGAIAGGMGLTFGKSFVAGDPSDITYTKARCADYFEYEPSARTCEQAATQHHYGEVVFSRLAAGVLGLMVLGAYLWARRRWAWVAERGALPEGFEATVGASLFGLAAALLLGQGASRLAVGETAGSGAYVSAGIVSLVVAGAFAWSLYRSLLRGWAVAEGEGQG
jgi:hypothetical protein